MDETSNRYKFFSSFNGIIGYRKTIIVQMIFFVLIKTKIITVGQECMVTCVVIPNLVKNRWDIRRFILLFTFCHIQWVCDVSVVCNTSIFTHLQVVVVENEM